MGTQARHVPVQAAHELETASLRGAISAAQETAEGLRAQAEKQARAASAAQEALQERLEQLQSELASLDAAKGQSLPFSLYCACTGVEDYSSNSRDAWTLQAVCHLIRWISDI